MNRLIVVLVIVFLMVSCQKELTFEPLIYTNNGCNNDNNCVKIDLKLVEAKNLKTVSDSINYHLFLIIKDMMTFSEGEVDTSTVYKSLLTNYEKAYQLSKSELQKDYYPSWEFSCEAKLYYEDEFFVNLIVEHYQFTGGAHGYSATQSILIDKINGKKLNYEKMFTNLEMVKSKVESAFREQFKIPLGKSLNEYGFFFENDQFILPENIFFSNDTILFVYNPYEIAPYAKGILEVPIKRSELDKYLYINKFDAN